MRRLAIAPLVAAMFVAAPARANYFEIFGGDPRGVGMGGAQVSSANDYTATFFNPALLGLQKQFSFGMGYSWEQPSMDVRPVNQGNSASFQPAKPLDFGGATLGVVFPLGGKVENRLALGVNLFMPAIGMIRTEGVDTNVPAWYQYESGPARMVLAAGAGARITDWLTAGVGVQVLGALQGSFNFTYNIPNKSIDQRGINTDFVSRTAPIAGLALNFKDAGLRFGFSYRGALEVDYHLPTTVSMGSDAQMEVGLDGVAQYTPHTFSLGATWRYESLITSAELRYALWSRAPNPATLVTMKINGNLIKATGLDGKLDAEAVNQKPGFVDTLSPYFGLEYLVVERFAVRLGYAFHATPVPLQNGDMNILDGNSHTIAGGVGVSFDDPLEIFARPIHLELAAQRLFIPERQASKSAGSNVPSYVYGGQVSSVSGALRYEFF